MKVSLMDIDSNTTLGTKEFFLPPREGEVITFEDVREPFRKGKPTFKVCFVQWHVWSEKDPTVTLWCREDSR